MLGIASKLGDTFKYLVSRLGKGKKKEWSLTPEGGGSSKTKSLFRFAISFKFLMCTSPICGEIVYWGS